MFSEHSFDRIFPTNPKKNGLRHLKNKNMEALHSVSLKRVKCIKTVTQILE